MYDITQVYGQTKEEMYDNLLLFANGLVGEERDAIANMANVAALIYHTLSGVNWAGFYLFKEEQLVLGPFHGKPACIRIAIGKGVCGTAADTRETQLVKDVHTFPGHIACDGDTNSEIVIPMIYENKLIGVLDLDSPILGRFDEQDQIYLERLVTELMTKCQWA